MYRSIQAGGGGYGDPLERDPMAVLNDVCQEKVTPDRAIEYGVVIVGDVPEVDFAETKKLRAILRKKRGSLSLDPRVVKAADLD